MKAYSNTDIARLFRQVAAAYTITGQNRFRIIAYDNAATAVEHATSELKDLWEDGKLDSVPGLGSTIIGHLDELFKTGHSKHFEEAIGKVNPAVFPLLEVPGIGPKKAEKLVEKLHLSDPKTVIADLKKAAVAGLIAPIESFGAKSEQDILENIGRHEKGAIKEKRMVLPLASRIAEEIIDYMKEKMGKKLIRMDKLGSLRRQVATIGDLDFAVCTDEKNFEEAIDVFISFPGKASLIERGPTGASILLGLGRQADFRVAKPDDYGAMLQYFTGSKYHNIRLRDYALKQKQSLNEYGIKDLKTEKLKKFESEEKLYNFLGLDYIPPELREDTGEIEAAKNHTLPDLVELKDIKGDLQIHSNYDLETSHDSGVDTMEAIAKMGEKLGYQYVGITDHNPSQARHTEEQIVAKLQKQKEYVEKLNNSLRGTKVLNLLEVDMTPDGRLTVPDKGLETLDGCLVSVHSSFALPKQEMTDRVLKGLSHPVARILAHPTGRLLQEREGYELDWDRVFRFCLEKDKALEINAYPDRLDISDTLVREAVKKGVKLTIGTDSHAKEQMTNMEFGVSVARRGWAQKTDILNTLNFAKMLTWLHQRR